MKKIKIKSEKKTQAPAWVLEEVKKYAQGLLSLGFYSREKVKKLSREFLNSLLNHLPWGREMVKNFKIPQPSEEKSRVAFLYFQFRHLVREVHEVEFILPDDREEFQKLLCEENFTEEFYVCPRCGGTKFEWTSLRRKIEHERYFPAGTARISCSDEPDFISSSEYYAKVPRCKNCGYMPSSDDDLDDYSNRVPPERNIWIEERQTGNYILVIECSCNREAIDLYGLHKVDYSYWERLLDVYPADEFGRKIYNYYKHIKDVYEKVFADELEHDS